MDDNIEKVYTQQIIDDVPFPQTGEADFTTSQSTSNNTYTPEKIEEQIFPKKKIATELLSSALNTRSKKIIKEFEFTSSGALQIGSYTEGITGDIRISPNGIEARDSTGTTTFALDATTGDAIFKGTIQAGSVIATTISGENIIANTMDADRIKASTLDVAVDVGTGAGASYVRLDGENNRIIIHDGTNPRILIGED